MQPSYSFILKCVLPLLAVFLVALMLPFFWNRSRPVAFTPEAFGESTAVLKNPYQGFYRIFGYTLSDDGQHVQTTAADSIREYDFALVLLEINLRNYRTGPISDSALAQLDDILKAWSQSDAQILLRFLYDWDGIAKAKEPESLSTILTHMDQAAEIVNRYASSIYLMQGCFIGNWGEMHGSYFADSQSIQTLITHLHQVIAPSIYLSVRTPAQWRTITGLYDVPAKFPAFQDQPSITGRLGLFNDGMLGSLSDLGTYGDTLRKDASAPSYKGVREEELSFQNALCQYVPNGGEVVYDTAYNALPAAVQYLKTIHVSYLNADYDQTVLQKWSRTIWNGEDAFSGCDGLTYVKAHLGYRYTVRGCTLQKHGLLQSQVTVQLTLENTGFGNTLKPFEGAFLLRNVQTEETRRLPLVFDFRSLTGGQTKTLTASLPARELPEGTWQLFFSVTDPATGGQIALANTAYHEGDGLLLGQLED